MTNRNIEKEIEEINEKSWRAVEKLQPQLYWKKFFDISRIPRESYHEEKMNLFLIEYAKRHQIEYEVDQIGDEKGLKKDQIGNVVFHVKANHEEFKNKPKVVLQAHQDMVIDVDRNIKPNFNPQIHPIELKLARDEKLLIGNGTSLGADDGMGIATILYLIEDDTFLHGDLDCLFTVAEEEGFEGVLGLSSSFISGQYLINLDSGSFGKFTIGCCGANDTILKYKVEAEKNNNVFDTSYELMLHGGIGGHSAGDIWRDRSNAIKLIGRLLNKYFRNGWKYSISDINGGSHENAIPNSARITINIKKEDASEFKRGNDLFLKDILSEYGEEEEDLSIRFSEKGVAEPTQFTKEFERKIVKVIYAIPHGVIKNSQEFSKLTESSTNLGRILLETATEEEEEEDHDQRYLTIRTMQRSNKKYYIREIVQQVRFIGELSGADVITQWIDDDDFVQSGIWESENPNSELVKIAKESYMELFNEKPVIKPTHSGLECGILKQKYPDMQIISTGATYRNPHSVSEYFEVKTVPPFLKLIKKIFKKIYEEKESDLSLEEKEGEELTDEEDQENE